MEIPGSGAQIQVPGAQHEAYVGEVEKSKKPENFRGPEKCPPATFSSGFRAIFRSGAEFSKKRHFWRHAPDTPETESRPAAQTLGTVRMLSGLRSWTSTNSLKLILDLNFAILF